MRGPRHQTSGSGILTALGTFLRTGTLPRPERTLLRNALWILAFIAAIFAILYLGIWHEDAREPGDPIHPGASDAPGAPD